MKHLLTTAGQRLPFPWRAFIAVFPVIAAVGLISAAPSQAALRPGPARAVPAQPTSQRAASYEANCWAYFTPRILSEVKCDTVVNRHKWYFCGRGGSTLLSIGYGLSYHGHLKINEGLAMHPSSFFTNTTDYLVTAHPEGLAVSFRNPTRSIGFFTGHPIGAYGTGSGPGRWHPSFCG